MKAEFNAALFLTGLGLALMLLGLCHRQPLLAQWDARTFQTLHNRLEPLAGFFRFIWPLGTTPVAILLILILFIPGWQIGLVVTIIYALAAAIESGIKRQMRRPRPFESLPHVRMHQPKRPHDPSHPSGDTVRVWFVALIFPAAFGLAPWVYALSLGAAATLSLGRISLGVHYPLDVLGGAGLGWIAAGLAILSFQSSVFSL